MTADAYEHPERVAENVDLEYKLMMLTIDFVWLTLFPLLNILSFKVVLK